MIRRRPFTADSASPGAASRPSETVAVRLMPPMSGVPQATGPTTQGNLLP